MENAAYIDDYFSGRLDNQQKIIFDQRIQQDPAFAEEVAFYCSEQIAAFDENAKQRKEELRKLWMAESAVPAGKSKVISLAPWRPLLVAATVILLLAGAYLFVKPANPNGLAGKYMQEQLSQLPVEMDARQDSLKTGITLYNSKNFPAAAAIFESIVKRDSVAMDALQYAGLVSLQMGDFDKAIDYFEQLENNKELQVNPGRFYHALALMRRNQPGDLEKAKAKLQEVVQLDLAGKKTAREWLDKF